VEIKEKILQTAETLFMRYGIKSVTMDDLAKELAISKKTIYQFFKDKNEVVCLTTRAHLEKEQRDISDIHSQAENAIQEIYLISKIFRQRVLGLNPSLLFDLERYHPEAWAIFQEYREVFMSQLRETLQRGQEEGYFRAEIDVDVMAVLRLHEIQVSFDPRIFSPNHFDYKQVQMALTDHFVNGITTQKGKQLLDSYHNNSTVS